MSTPNTSYGLVVRTAIGLGSGADGFPHKTAWRGLIYDYDEKGKGREAWRGTQLPTPEDALERLEKECDMRDVTDIRPWNGSVEDL